MSRLPPAGAARRLLAAWVRRPPPGPARPSVLATSAAYSCRRDFALCAGVGWVILFSPWPCGSLQPDRISFMNSCSRSTSSSTRSVYFPCDLPRWHHISRSPLHSSRTRPCEVALSSTTWPTCESGNLAQHAHALVEHGGEHDVRACNPVFHLLAPARIGCGRFLGGSASQHLAQRIEGRPRHGDQHFAAAAGRLQPELGNHDRIVPAPDDVVVDFVRAVASTAKAVSATVAESRLERFGDAIEESRRRRAPRCARAADPALERRLRAVAAQHGLDNCKHCVRGPRSRAAGHSTWRHAARRRRSCRRARPAVRRRFRFRCPAASPAGAAPPTAARSSVQAAAARSNATRSIGRRSTKLEEPVKSSAKLSRPVSALAVGPDITGYAASLRDASASPPPPGASVSCSTSSMVGRS